MLIAASVPGHSQVKFKCRADISPQPPALHSLDDGFMKCEEEAAAEWETTVVKDEKRRILSVLKHP